ncbi:MAG TPA: 6-carboxytetrahydropterin synthase [Bdellovibrionota bacterium]|nr:6-carboxytetrahydropterin synthase [Bdellovibrionota bacterium]
MHYVTKKITFAASHRLHNPKLSDAENREIFDVCNNPNGHGHTYTLEVTVKGEVNPETGMVINVRELKRIMVREIFDHVDHKNLNVDVSWLEGVIPTTENLCVAFWERLRGNLKYADLHSIKLSESPNSLFEYYGDPS